MSARGRIYTPYTTFIEYGGVRDDLIKHCNVVYRNKKSGHVDRMKYEGPPNKYDWQGPFRIWFLKLSPGIYRFYDTEQEAEGWKTLRGI